MTYMHVVHQNFTVEENLRRASDAQDYEALKKIIAQYKYGGAINNLQIPNLLNTLILHSDLENIKFIFTTYDDELKAFTILNLTDVFAYDNLCRFGLDNFDLRIIKFILEKKKIWKNQSWSRPYPSNPAGMYLTDKSFMEASGINNLLLRAVECGKKTIIEYILKVNHEIDEMGSELDLIGALERAIDCENYEIASLVLSYMQEYPVDRFLQTYEASLNTNKTKIILDMCYDTSKTTILYNLCYFLLFEEKYDVVRFILNTYGKTLKGIEILRINGLLQHILIVSRGEFDKHCKIILDVYSTVPDLIQYLEINEMFNLVINDFVSTTGRIVEITNTVINMFETIPAKIALLKINSLIEYLKVGRFLDCQKKNVQLALQILKVEQSKIRLRVQLQEKAETLKKQSETKMNIKGDSEALQGMLNSIIAFTGNSGTQ